jgi:hypothetical protein
MAMPLVAINAPRFSFGACALRRAKTFGRLMPWATPKSTREIRRKSKVGVTAMRARPAA